MRAAQRGDRLALNRLLRELAPVVGPICGAIALDLGDDAMQETMIAVVRNLGARPDTRVDVVGLRAVAISEEEVSR